MKKIFCFLTVWGTLHLTGISSVGLSASQGGQLKLLAFSRESTLPRASPTLEGPSSLHHLSRGTRFLCDSSVRKCTEISPVEWGGTTWALLVSMTLSANFVHRCPSSDPPSISHRHKAARQRTCIHRMPSHLWVLKCVLK